MDARARDLTVPHMGVIIWIRGAFLCVFLRNFLVIFSFSY